MSIGGNIGNNENITVQSGLFGDGSIASPSISFINETNSGFCRVGTGDIGLIINGNKVGDITSAGVSIISITGGSFLPTLSGAVNVTVGTIATGIYQKINNAVTYSGKFYVTPSNATWQVTINVPVSPSSNFSGGDKIYGQMMFTTSAGNTSTPGYCFSDDASITGTLRITNSPIAAGWCSFNLCYSIS